MRKFARSLTVAISALALLTTTALADNGIINVQSAHNAEVTASRLENILNKKGMTIFNRINHAEAATKIGITLRPTELIIFGNPKVGSLLMQCSQSAALDLPQKALIWQDESGKTWLSYNSPSYLAKRHNIEGCDKPIAKITNALEKFAKAATSK